LFIEDLLKVAHKHFLGECCALGTHLVSIKNITRLNKNQFICLFWIVVIDIIKTGSEK